MNTKHFLRSISPLVAGCSFGSPKLLVIRRVLIVTLFALIGCSSVGTPSSTASAAKAKFDEKHPNMFVFVEKPEGMHKYGYRNFCKSPDVFGCPENLEYKKHLGKRGYFVSMEPLPQSGSEEVREVILETGARLYFSVEPYEGNILGIANGDIVWVEQLAAAAEKENQPIVPESPVAIIRSEISYGRSLFYVNDGESFSEDELAVVQRLLKTFNTREHDVEIVTILQDAICKWDRIEQMYLISIAPYFVNNELGPISISIVQSKGVTSLVERVQYTGDDWLFVGRYIIVAGEERYESPSIEFKRDNTDEKVWEWSTQITDDERRGLLSAVAANSDAVVRFYGSDYHSDETVDDKQREALRRMLRLYDLLSTL